MNKDKIKKVLIDTRRTVEVLDEATVEGAFYLNQSLWNFCTATNTVKLIYVRTNLAKNTVISSEEETCIIWDVTYWKYLSCYQSICQSSDMDREEKLAVLIYTFLKEKYGHFPHVCNALQKHIDEYYKGIETVNSKNDDQVIRAVQTIALYHEIGHIIFKKEREHRNYCYHETHRVLNNFFDFLHDKETDILELKKLVNNDLDIEEELVADYFAIKEFLPVIDNDKLSFIDRIYIILDAAHCFFSFNYIMTEVQQNWQRFLPMMMNNKIQKPTSLISDQQNFLKNFVGFWIIAYHIFEHYNNCSEINIWEEWGSMHKKYSKCLLEWYEVIFDLTYEDDIKQIITDAQKLW